MGTWHSSVSDTLNALQRQRQADSSRHAALVAFLQDAKAYKDSLKCEDEGGAMSVTYEGTTVFSARVEKGTVIVSAHGEPKRFTDLDEAKAYMATLAAEAIQNDRDRKAAQATEEGVA